jgi:hypothetical protein
VVDSAEDDLEGARQARGAELCKEAPLVFSEYRIYNRIQLTDQRGWDQYLSQTPVAQSPVPVVGVADNVVTVAAGQAVGSRRFFDPRSSPACRSSDSDSTSGFE